MIDRERRDRFAELLRQFVAGLFTNDEFEDRLEEEILPQGPARDWPEPFLWMMYGMAWLLYCDMRKPYKLRGKDAIPPEGRRNIARWILFLYSDREYELPLLDPFTPEGDFLDTAACPSSLAGCLLSLFTWGTARHQAAEWEAWDMFYKSIDVDLWPYRSRDDLKEDRQHPRLLAGKE